MSVTRIPNRRAEAAILDAAYEAERIIGCGHGKTWEEKCPECCSIWREDRCRDLVKTAAKYGFRLVPLRER